MTGYHPLAFAYLSNLKGEDGESILTRLESKYLVDSSSLDALRVFGFVDTLKETPILAMPCFVQEIRMGGGVEELVRCCALYSGQKNIGEMWALIDKARGSFLPKVDPRTFELPINSLAA